MSGYDETATLLKETTVPTPVGSMLQNAHGVRVIIDWGCYSLLKTVLLLVQRLIPLENNKKKEGQFLVMDNPVWSPWL